MNTRINLVCWCSSPWLNPPRVRSDRARRWRNCRFRRCSIFHDEPNPTHQSRATADAREGDEPDRRLVGTKGDSVDSDESSDQRAERNREQERDEQAARQHDQHSQRSSKPSRHSHLLRAKRLGGRLFLTKLAVAASEILPVPATGLEPVTP